MPRSNSDDPDPDRSDASFAADLPADDPAVWPILEDYRPRLRRAVDLRMDPMIRGRVDPSDVIQESYLEVRERLPSYRADPKMPFYVWVRFLTLQKLLQVRRRHVEVKQRDSRREVRLSPDPNASAVNSQILARELIESQLSPSQIVSQKEQHRLLHDALEELPEIDREILALRHFEQLENQEIAQILGLSESAASHRHLRALKRLTDRMKEHGSSGPNL